MDWLVCCFATCWAGWMGWKRLPSHFVNFPLRLLPLTPKQQNFVNSTGSLKEIVFKTVPSVGKVCFHILPSYQSTSRVHPKHDFTFMLNFRQTCSDSMHNAISAGFTYQPHSFGMQFEIRQYLERIYGLTVKDIRTLNVEGKKKRTKYGYYRRTDYKKAYVTLKEPAPAQGAIRRKEEDQPNSWQHSRVSAAPFDMSKQIWSYVAVSVLQIQLGRETSATCPFWGVWLQHASHSSMAGICISSMMNAFNFIGELW